MNRPLPLTVLAATLLAGAGAMALAGTPGIYLVQGQGAEGSVVLGQTRDAKAAQTDREGWYPVAGQDGLAYRLGGDGRVAILRCQVAACITDRGVRVGDSESVVIRRYGAPLADAGATGLLRYPGIGFLVRDGRVSVIYILPG